MKKIPLILAVCIGCASPTRAQTPENSRVWMFGSGLLWSCAKWLSTPATKAEGTVWIYGYWSGLNSMRTIYDDSGDIGKTTDAAGISGEVELFCKSVPSMKLSEAVGRVYTKFVERNR